MIWQEADLKRHLKDAELKRVYFLYGDEPYLAAHYVNKLISLAVGETEPDDFNVEKFDGQSADASDIAAAVMTLPMMADRKCVVVQDANITQADETAMETWLSLLSDLPDTCVLIVWLCVLSADDTKESAAKSGEKKGRKCGQWKTFIAAAEKAGAVVRFDRPTPNDCARLLMSGAKKRGCELPDRVAAPWVERCGTDLHRLVNELDKLCALADGGTITEEMVVSSTAETLEAKVFDLSKMIMQGNAARAFAILHTLRADKEKPVSVLSVLSMAYADLYRVKVAQTAGEPAESLTRVFNYGNRAFVLRNAARDVARMSEQAVTDSLECLAQADIEMKSNSMDKWWILDRTVTQLMALRRG